MLILVYGQSVFCCTTNHYNHFLQEASALPNPVAGKASPLQVLPVLMPGAARGCWETQDVLSNITSLLVRLGFLAGHPSAPPCSLSPPKKLDLIIPSIYHTPNCAIFVNIHWPKETTFAAKPRTMEGGAWSSPFLR